MVGKFLRISGDRPERLQPPSWAKSLHKVRARDLIKFLRDVPLYGVDYLLIIDGQIRGRYNQQISLGALQVLAGNYLVYEIDVTVKPIQFTLERVAFADPVMANITFELAYRIVSPEELFRSNLSEIEPEIKRRITRQVKTICFEHASQDYHTALHKVEHFALNLPLECGVEIVSGVVEFQMPDSVNQSTTRRAATVSINDWVRADIEFNEEFKFHGRDYPYQVVVRMGIILDSSDLQSQQRLKESGVIDLKQRAQTEAREAVRRQLRKYASNIHDAEEYAGRELRNMKFDFGVRVDYGTVEIIQTAAQEKAMREERFESELRNLLIQGWDAVLIRAAARPSFKEQIMEFIESRRKLVEYEDGRDQKLLDAQISRIEKSIQIGVLDPELMDRNAQQALTNYLLGSSGNSSASPANRQMVSGNMHITGQLTDSAGKNDIVTGKFPEKQSDMNIILPSKPDSDWDDD